MTVLASMAILSYCNNMDYYHKNHPRKKRKHFIKTALIIIAVIFISLLLFSAGIFAYFAKDLPDPAEISERKITQSTKIYDRTGKILLYDIHGEEKRTIVPFDEIPQYVKNATIVAEDDDFYKHSGFDIRGIIRAFWVDIKNRQIRQGGSTITQQFIKQAVLTSDRTFTRKIKEIILALQTEQKYSKDEILNFYLNQVPYGSNAYGIEAAAITFFNKTAEDLTLSESAILAALPKAPTYYSPYGNNEKDLKNRQIYILERMFAKGYITAEELEKAKNEEMEFSQEFRNIRAPHFVMYIKSYLVEKYGEDAIETRGFKVTTTLDWDLQEKAEKIVKERVEINRKNYKANNAALAAINPNNGEILSMVGSYDYFDAKNDGNVNVAIRPRQPGSSFKPFVYAQAFIKGLAPDTLLFDLKTEFNPSCPADGSQEKDQYGLECYHPQNYDSQYRGPIKIQSALAQSLNIPAVKVLY
ncbi:MAG: transglycosylase domain-containing protein, partial [Patescibacteria group bacterium]